ncbi:MAG: D-alanyl-D-alanine carboxypeptidase, partial [Saprospiraceae bacterium]|nr:D-alanyl-D-alanine carboxypeptidase [Saprospiraceae bacterium]
SGLSARNLMSPDFLTSFLLLYGKDKSMSELENLLPPAGKRGTVKNILLQSKAKGNMLVKSGSMDKILTYSGYCKTVSGRMVSFSVFLNSSTAKKMKENKTELEKILDAIYRFY